MDVDFLYVEDDTKRNVNRGNEGKYEMEGLGQAGIQGGGQNSEDLNKGNYDERDDPSQTEIEHLNEVSFPEGKYLENKKIF